MYLTATLGDGLSSIRRQAIIQTNNIVHWYVSLVRSPPLEDNFKNLSQHLHTKQTINIELIQWFQSNEIIYIKIDMYVMIPTCNEASGIIYEFVSRSPKINMAAY